MTHNAAFKIRNVTTSGAWSPYADRGFDCSHGDELEVQLENQPALDVKTGVFATRASSLDAPALTYATSGALATPASTLLITVPEEVEGYAAHSWIIRCQTNGAAGVLVNGRTDYTVNTAERMICIRASGMRKIIAVERDEYSPSGGWADAQNEEVEGVIALLGSVSADVTALQSSLTTLAGRVTTAENNISTNTSNIASHASRLTALETDVNAATSAATSNALVRRDSSGEAALAALTSPIIKSPANSTSVKLARASGAAIIEAVYDGSNDKIGFFGGTPVVKPSIVSSESEIGTALGNAGLVTITGPAIKAYPSIARIAEGNAAARVSATRTTGCRVLAIETGISCLGADFYWNHTGGAVTATVRAWNAAGTQIEEQTVEVSATGVHSVTWASALDIARGTYISIGLYVPSVYCRWSTPTVGAPGGAYATGAYGAGVVIDYIWSNSSANTLPNTASAGAPPEKYTIGPRF